MKIESSKYGNVITKEKEEEEEKKSLVIIYFFSKVEIKL